MNDDHNPKQRLFCDLLQRRPFHGVDKRWCDKVAGDLCAIDVGDEGMGCQDRKQWSEICSSAIAILAQSRDNYLCC